MNACREGLTVEPKAQKNSRKLLKLPQKTFEFQCMQRGVDNQHQKLEIV